MVPPEAPHTKQRNVLREVLKEGTKNQLYKWVHRKFITYSLIVENPQQASRLPCRHKRTLGIVPQRVVVGKVAKRSHVERELVDKSVERLYFKSSLADAKPGNIFVELCKESIVILALAWNAAVALLAWLEGEDHGGSAPWCPHGYHSGGKRTGFGGN